MKIVEWMPVEHPPHSKDIMRMIEIVSVFGTGVLLDPESNTLYREEQGITHSVWLTGKLNDNS